MNVSIRNNFISFLALLICLISVVVLYPAMVRGEDYPGQGKDQLVQALDAAIARVINSGEWRAIVNSDPDVAPLIVNMADCYPRIEDGEDVIYPFPENPVGLLKEILDTKQIIVGDYDVNDPFTPGTFHVFDNVNPALLRAIIDELGAGYSIPKSPNPGAIEIVPNYLWPPSSALMFERLALGRDWVDPEDPTQRGHDINGFNAALGATVSVDGVEKRRRDVARFTCTVFGTNWYAHVRDDSSYQTIDDLIADSTADFCVGQLSSRLSEDYFQNAQSIDKQFTADDLVVCSEGVRDGVYDAYLHFDPTPVSYPEPNDLRAIPLQIVSGIPIWVAKDASSTTTSTLQPCPSTAIYGQSSEQTEILRHFRDTILNKTPEGEELIKLYYQWGPLIVKVMEQDREFKKEVKEMIDSLLPLLGGTTIE